MWEQPVCHMWLPAWYNWQVWYIRLTALSPSVVERVQHLKYALRRNGTLFRTTGCEA